VTPSGGPATPAGRSDEPVSVPRFNVVLRGYDRRQVDEHLSRLQRRYNALRRGLDSAHSQAVPAPPGMSGARSRPRPDGPPPRADRPDVVGTFIARMQATIKAAEKEADEIRGKAQAAARAEEERAAAARAAARAAEESVRTSLAELVGQRDAALADLARVRGQLETQ
jgi:DivIVA domain-containing protein